jgi:hypothetical protein
MKRVLVTLFPVYISACMSLPVHSGKPWKLKMQSIPGRVECEFYDEGGEGIAYHDADDINNGSGKLNPPDGNMLNEFRMKEGVDISFTKAHGIDNNPYNKIEPGMNQLYVGWTEPGESINYTIKINEAGKYYVGLMYTANGDGSISLDIDGRQVASLVRIVSTYNAQDSIAWRQWHHWNRIDSLAQIEVPRGIHTLTLYIAGHGNMNFDYLEFKKE